MKKKDLVLILGMVLLAAALLAVGLSTRHSGSVDLAPGQPSGKSKGAGEEATEASVESSDQYSENVQKDAEEYFNKNAADSYLLIRTNQSASIPIPLNEEYSFTVSQHDGSENVIHVGVNSFYMESSNCDNQNCVEEGVVTLENMNERILFNMVLCLPHQLTLEMLTPDEAQSALLEMLAQRETMQVSLDTSEVDAVVNDSSGSTARAEDP